MTRPPFSVADQEHSLSLQQQYRFAQQQQSQYSDPAIMSASFGVPHAPTQEVFASQAFGPPGLVYPSGLRSNVANDGESSFFVSETVACVQSTERNAFIGRNVLRDSYDARA